MIFFCPLETCVKKNCIGYRDLVRETNIQIYAEASENKSHLDSKIETQSVSQNLQEVSGPGVLFQVRLAVRSNLAAQCFAWMGLEKLQG